MEAGGTVQDEFSVGKQQAPRAVSPRGPTRDYFFILANSVSFLFLSMRTIFSSDSSLMVSVSSSSLPPSGLLILTVILSPSTLYVPISSSFLPPISMVTVSLLSLVNSTVAPFGAFSSDDLVSSHLPTSLPASTFLSWADVPPTTRTRAAQAARMPFIALSRV